jgi:hypothetical protein
VTLFGEDAEVIEDQQKRILVDLRMKTGKGLFK